MSLEKNQNLVNAKDVNERTPNPNLANAKDLDERTPNLNLADSKDVDERTPNLNLVDANDVNERTPVHLAAILADEKCLDLFIVKQANVEVADKNGVSPLHLVVNSDSGDADKEKVLSFAYTSWSQTGRRKLEKGDTK